MVKSCLVTSMNPFCSSQSLLLHSRNAVTLLFSICEYVFPVVEMRLMALLLDGTRASLFFFFIGFIKDDFQISGTRPDSKHFAQRECRAESSLGIFRISFGKLSIPTALPFFRLFRTLCTSTYDIGTLRLSLIGFPAAKPSPLYVSRSAYSLPQTWSISTDSL